MAARPGVYEPYRPEDNGSSPSASKDFKSSDDTPLYSPRSPLTTHEHNAETTNTIKPAMSRDPRRTRVDQPTPVQPQNTSTESSLIDYLRDLARQVSCEEKVRDAEKRLQVTKEQANLMRQRFSDNNPLTDQYSKDCRRDEDALAKCRQILMESKDQTEKTLMNLPLKAREIFNGVIPASRQLSPRDELSDVRSAMKSLEEKMESLIKQNKEREMESRQLRERSTRPPSEPLEAELTSRITASQREVDSKFFALNEKLQKYNESLNLYGETIDQYKDDLQKQKGELRSLTSEQVSITGPVTSLQKRVEKLETQSTEAALRETPRSPPRDDHEDDLTEIKAQQKEHKRQMANLSNMFVPRQEYLDSFAKLEASTKLTEKLLRDSNEADQDLSSRLPGIVDRISYVTNELENTKRSMEEFAAADPKALHQRVNNLSQSYEQLQQSIETLSKNPAVQNATQVPVAQIPVHDSEIVSTLQKEVKKLTDFSGHYTKFYESTEGQLKQINQQLTTNDKRLNYINNGLQSRVESLSELCKKNQKAINEMNERQKSHEEQAQSVLSLRRQIEECRANYASSFARNAATVTEIKAMKVSIEQVCHSIQSLDTRYSAISTQKLYHSIIATIQPLIPQVYELKEQLSSVHRSIATWEQKATFVDNKIQSIEINRAETSIKIQALENKIKEPANTDAVQLAAPRPGGSTLQQVQNLPQEESGIRNTITILRGQHDDCISQLEILQDKIATMDQIVKDQQQNAADKADRLENLSQLYTELKQNKTGTDSKALEELHQIRDTIEGLRGRISTLTSTLSEESKVVDGLRADVGILDDLQSRVQNVQTDITTNRERLANIEADLPRRQDLDERLNQLQAKFGENPLDVWRAELVRSREEMRILGIQDADQIKRYEDALFPSQDRYIGCSNLASTIKEEDIRLCFKNCDIREVHFGGGKRKGENKTTRYAIIRVAQHTDTTVIDASIRAREGESWNGRKTIIRNISRDLFRTIWVNQPDCIKDQLLGTQDFLVNRASEVASTPGPAREMSVNNNNMVQQIPCNTIEMVRSSVLPRRPSTNLDVTELPDSDEGGETLLGQFGATRDGRPSKRPMSAKAESVRLSTPSDRAAPKRGAPDSGSSRPSSKRGRRG